jgi:hypothetical protein
MGKYLLSIEIVKRKLRPGIEGAHYPAPVVTFASLDQGGLT